MREVVYQDRLDAGSRSVREQIVRLALRGELVAVDGKRFRVTDVDFCDDDWSRLFVVLGERVEEKTTT